MAQHQHVREGLEQLVLEGVFGTLEDASAAMGIELDRARVLTHQISHQNSAFRSVGPYHSSSGRASPTQHHPHSGRSSPTQRRSLDPEGRPPSVPPPTENEESRSSSLKFQSRGNWPLPFPIHTSFADGYPSLRRRLKEAPSEAGIYVYEFGVADFESQAHADDVLGRLRTVCDGLSTACLHNNHAQMATLRDRLDDHLAYWTTSSRSSARRSRSDGDQNDRPSQVRRHHSAPLVSPVPTPAPVAKHDGL